ncbi:MAG: cysteine desulfurase NifS, partial [Pseudomonadota bacterium]|nr:cysteine desulfurase NifS [Pseudomonadota bacterium]
QLDVTADTLRDKRDRLHHRLLEAVPGLLLNGHPEARLPNTLNVSFPNVSGKVLLEQVSDTVAASTGSACHANSDTVSGVLGAMGLDRAQASGAVRLSVGKSTSDDQIDLAARALIRAWQTLTTK